jgi:hypothetical protein
MGEKDKSKGIYIVSNYSLLIVCINSWKRNRELVGASFSPCFSL